MKAYKIKITLRESNPLIWRRIIVPAEITFKILHDIIQYSMGWENYHLYDFNIKEEKLRVTGDEQALGEYEFYSKLKLTRKDPNGYIAKMVEMKPILSQNVKIDKYLIQWKNIEYVYDFGDYWKHDIILEEILEDCKYTSPVCLEGERPCPPEDVGGVEGYKEFLEIISDKNNPDHEKLKEWAESQGYKYSFDIKNINELMFQKLKLKDVNDIKGI